MDGTETSDELTRAQKALLLKMAREAIAEQLTRGSLTKTELDDETLCRPAGAFVTLEIDDRLRGCIGSMEADLPLHRQVTKMAVASATEDDRFAALSMSELKFVEIEISVLSPMSPIRPNEVQVGTHGLYVGRGRNRGVFLPQVPVQQGWDRARYLAQLLEKAGLDRDALEDPRTKLLSFTATVFGDRDLLEQDEEDDYYS